MENAQSAASGQQTEEQAEMARLIVDVLNLEDVDPTTIDPSVIMFQDEGLGLDSIDALEIAVAIAENYGVHISAEDEATKEIFATLGNLTAHVRSEMNTRG
ncbi:MAG: phosphopantetheine-binding protein [Pseudomonadota bacterium]